jgi:hypothetical protein
MTAETHCTDIRVDRIEHARGDGLGRALVLDCRGGGGGLSLLLDDPAELRRLIEDLSRGVAWITERSRDLLERSSGPDVAQADGGGEEHISER